ncbi:hypothetical protein ACLOJK_012898 [Asimina triloba]
MVLEREGAADGKLAEMLRRWTQCTMSSPSKRWWPADDPNRGLTSLRKVGRVALEVDAVHHVIPVEEVGIDVVADIDTVEAGGMHTRNREVVLDGVFIIMGAKLPEIWMVGLAGLTQKKIPTAIGWNWKSCKSLWGCRRRGCGINGGDGLGARARLAEEDGSMGLSWWREKVWAGSAKWVKEDCYRTRDRELNRAPSRGQVSDELGEGSALQAEEGENGLLEHHRERSERERERGQPFFLQLSHASAGKRVC